MATYGGLCALAALDRSELQSRVLSNIGFKEFLELVPEVRHGPHTHAHVHVHARTNSYQLMQ